jgi:hypothetical protein
MIRLRQNPRVHFHGIGKKSKYVIEGGILGFRFVGDFIRQMQCLSQLNDETYVACDNECDISAIQEMRHILDV